MRGLDIDRALTAEFDWRLLDLMRQIRASGGSIYAPLRSPDGEVRGLAFVSVKPRNPHSVDLGAMRIPMRSVAGRCFETGEAFIASEPGRDREHFKRAEMVAYYVPTSMLNVALAFGGQTVGVLQLLRTTGEAGFSDDDLAAAQANVGDLGARLAEAAG
jgi:hypothetical protein